MTGQISDGIRLRRKLYQVAGVNGTGLFQPQDHGIHPRADFSPCWRGFICSYSAARGRLRLASVSIRLRSDEITSINGVEPELPDKVPRDRSTWARYRLNMIVDFTGGILAARDFVKGLNVEMGFTPAWKYKDVHEIIYERGVLKEIRDCSSKMEEVRGLLSRHLEPEPGADESTVREWIERAFSLAY